jgi:hypothetical protein
MIEVWKNTAAGMRWYKILDRQGREVGKTVQGGRTFTLAPFDRQINQDEAASPEQDLFRNGNLDEIESSDSFTDAELSALVHEILAKDKTIEQVIYPIESPVTLGRLMEELVIEDASKSAIDAVRKKKETKEGTVAVEREYIAPAAPSEPEVETPSDIPKVETPDMVVTQPEKV